MTLILMVSAKLTTSRLLEIKYYDGIFSVQDLTNKVLSLDSNHNERSYLNFNFTRI